MSADWFETKLQMVLSITIVINVMVYIFVVKYCDRLTETNKRMTFILNDWYFN